MTTFCRKCWFKLVLFLQQSQQSICNLRATATFHQLLSPTNFLVTASYSNNSHIYTIWPQPIKNYTFQNNNKFKYNNQSNYLFTSTTNQGVPRNLCAFSVVIRPMSSLGTKAYSLLQQIFWLVWHPTDIILGHARRHSCLPPRARTIQILILMHPGGSR